MEIKRKGARSLVKGPAENFTGDVRIDMPFQTEAPGRAGGGFVSFEPDARTAWRTHPLGQTLIVASGVGWTRCEGGPKVEIRAGDVIWCPVGHCHWHGATPAMAMSRTAIAESLDGRAVD